MIHLINLLVRICTGEKLERSSPEVTARWLGVLAYFPVFLLSGGWIFRRLDRMGYLDNYWELVAATVLWGVFGVYSLVLLAKAFRRFPMWLLLLAVTTWGLAGIRYMKIPG